MSTEHQRAAPKTRISRLQLAVLVLQLLVIVLVFASFLSSQWERDDRMKQIERLEVEQKQLEIRLQQLQKAIDKREKRDIKAKVEPAKAKPDAAGNKASQLHRLDWPEGCLVDDRLAMPVVSWTAPVAA
jgi:Flp pilus assembly protein TadB